MSVVDCPLRVTIFFLISTTLSISTMVNFVIEHKLRKEIRRLELDNCDDSGLVEAIVHEQKAVGSGH